MFIGKNHPYFVFHFHNIHFSVLSFLFHMIFKSQNDSRYIKECKFSQPVIKSIWTSELVGHCSSWNFSPDVSSWIEETLSVVFWLATETEACVVWITHASVSVAQTTPSQNTTEDDFCSQNEMSGENLHEDHNLHIWKSKLICFN